MWKHWCEYHSNNYKCDRCPTTSQGNCSGFPSNIRAIINRHLKGNIWCMRTSTTPRNPVSIYGFDRCDGKGRETLLIRVIDFPEELLLLDNSMYITGIIVDRTNHVES